MPYFVLVSIVLALLTKRNLATLLELRFKYWYLILGGLACQIGLNAVHFDGTTSARWLLDLFFGCVLLGIFLNRHIKGMNLILFGALLNFFVIVFHHGTMPVLGSLVNEMHLSKLGSRHSIASTSWGWWLADWIPVPPFIMSPGDILVGSGVIRFVLLNARRRREE
ncbi:DUF5317 family protein [Alicyclobacillus fodiniaquatilis]|uniref:DUF5317 family protein n=1 Tax=Alicyclobacillus fodiniaquatilis TaxID=1661150 RepID=A0ABW4JPP5_9BACL